MTKRPSALGDFLHGEAAGGVLLMVAAALALIAANLSATAGSYRALLATRLGPMTVHHWINDGAMALFFLLVGLEIKRELVDGELSSAASRRLPAIAAAAGMAIPALIYLIVTIDTPGLARGWAIPSATDIAFAIGVLALLGSRAPASLKLFLTTVAIVDDIGAVAIIALAYSQGISGPALLAAAVIVAGMMTMNRAGVARLWPYLAGAAALWLAVLLSGVHPTVAGVIAAATIPIHRTSDARDAEDSLLHRLEQGLHPWVAYAIVPLFGLANAGVSFAGVGAGQLLSALPLGIALGLFLGKQLGVFGSIWLADRLGFARRPGSASWAQLYGVALLCGIGFTMSLFIGALAFPDPARAEAVRLGVLMGSLLSAVAGYLVLRFASRKG